MTAAVMERTCNHRLQPREKTCGTCLRAERRTTSESSTLLTLLMDRGWSIPSLARHFGVPRSTVHGWRVKLDTPKSLRKLAAEWVKYPPAAQMFTDLKTRGWGPVAVARRIGARSNSVQGWMAGTHRCTVHTLIPALHELWASGEIATPPTLHAGRARRYRRTPAPLSWDPDSTRTCLTDPQQWDDESGTDRAAAAALCATCPVLEACRANLRRDLREGVNVSGVIAGLYIPWRAREKEA